MNTFTYLAILGNTPELSALELERCGVTAKWQGGRIAEIDAPVDLERIAGTVKVAEIIGRIPRSLDGVDIGLDMLQNTETRNKLRYGFSVYAGDAATTEQVVKHYAKKLWRVSLDWKKELRKAGRSVRVVTADDVQLSSVIVQKEGLLEQKTDIVVAVYNKEIILARTITVQPFEDFVKRDEGRPERDRKSGMLPTKVARMMVNIATGGVDVGIGRNLSLLDPFCGSGTVLQEAHLAGVTNLFGTDTSKKAVEDTQANLAWLQASANVQLADARDLASVLPANSIQFVVAEGYLGPVHPKKTEKIQRQMLDLYSTFFRNLPQVLTPGATVVFAVPAWKRYEGIDTLSLDSVLAEAGLEQWHEPIFYGRAKASVLRQILFLSKQ